MVQDGKYGCGRMSVFDGSSTQSLLPNNPWSWVSGSLCKVPNQHLWKWGLFKFTLALLWHTWHLQLLILLMQIKLPWIKWLFYLSSCSSATHRPMQPIPRVRNSEINSHLALVFSSGLQYPYIMNTSALRMHFNMLDFCFMYCLAFTNYSNLNLILHHIYLDLILICHLSENGMGSDGAAAISDILPHLSNLQKLYLQWAQPQPQPYLYWTMFVCWISASCALNDKYFFTPCLTSHTHRLALTYCKCWTVCRSNNIKAAGGTSVALALLFLTNLVELELS